MNDSSPSSSGTPTGSVSFYLDNSTTGTLLGTASLNSAGVPTLVTTAVPVNTHYIIALYGGDGNFTGSNGSLSQVVQYAAVGLCYGDVGHAILQPVNGSGSSVFKNGSTVPLKFRVCDATGTSIGTPGLVRGLYLVNSYAGTIGGVNELVYTSNPDAGFRWDPTAQQWIFNYNTKLANLQNGTYQYAIVLNDGTYVPFAFGLK